MEVTQPETPVERVLSLLHRKESWPIVALGLFATALVVRLVGLVLVPETNISTNAEHSILGGAELIRQGQFIANPDYPLMLPPITALFVAMVQSLFGTELIYVKLSQIVLDASSIVLIFTVGRLLLPYTAAVVGGMLVAVYPFMAFTPLYLGSEVLFTFFLALFVLTGVRAMQGNALSLLFAAGLCLGAATLTRGTTQFLPLFVIGLLLWRQKGLTTRFFKEAMLFSLGFCLLIAPWTVRNLVVVDALIPVSTPGLAILNGSHETFWEIADRDKAYPSYFAELREHGITRPADASSIEKGEFYRAAAVYKYRQRWNEDPLSYAPFLAEKLARLWYATESGRNHTLILLLNLPIYALFGYGLWLLARQRSPEIALLVVLITYFVALHVAVFALFRYMVPIMPYLILIGARGAVAAFQRLLPSLTRAPRAETAQST